MPPLPSGHPALTTFGKRSARICFKQKQFFKKITQHFSFLQFLIQLCFCCFCLTLWRSVVKRRGTDVMRWWSCALQTTLGSGLPTRLAGNNLHYKTQMHVGRIQKRERGMMRGRCLATTSLFLRQRHCLARHFINQNPALDSRHNPDSITHKRIRILGSCGHLWNEY